VRFAGFVGLIAAISFGLVFGVALYFATHYWQEQRRPRISQNKKERLDRIMWLWIWLGVIAGVIASCGAAVYYLTPVFVAATFTQPKERPWVGVDVAALDDIRFADDGSATVHLKFTANNSGRMPANNARIRAEVICPHSDNEFVNATIKRRDEICAEAIHRLDDPSLGTVFPGKTPELTWSFGVDAHTIAAQFERPTKFVCPFLVGCVTYTFSANGQELLGQTGFVYEVRKGAPEVPGGVFCIPIGENVPRSEVFIFKSTNGDFAR